MDFRLQGFGGGQDNWNNYANEVGGSWDRGNSGNSGHSQPQPLLPGLKGNRRMMGSGEFPLIMRGLPWSATEADISNFFSPINIRGVQIIFDETDRPSGSGNFFRFHLPMGEFKVLNDMTNDNCAFFSKSIFCLC